MSGVETLAGLRLRAAGNILAGAMVDRLQGFHQPGRYASTPPEGWYAPVERWEAVEEGRHWCPDCRGHLDDCDGLDRLLDDAVGLLSCPHGYGLKFCRNGCEVPA